MAAGCAPGGRLRASRLLATPGTPARGTRSPHRLAPDSPPERSGCPARVAAGHAVVDLDRSWGGPDRQAGGMASSRSRQDHDRAAPGAEGWERGPSGAWNMGRISRLPVQDRRRSRMVQRRRWHACTTAPPELAVAIVRRRGPVRPGWRVTSMARAGGGRRRSSRSCHLRWRVEISASALHPAAEMMMHRPRGPAAPCLASAGRRAPSNRW